MKFEKIVVVSLVAMLVLDGCGSDDSSDTHSTQTDTNTTTIPTKIHGYTLPPQPDEILNNATVLGIDSNDNGVRDDVEIWLLQKYEDKEPIYTEIAMQVGRAWQKVLENPENARETTKYMENAISCESYYLVCNKSANIITLTEDVDTKTFKNKVINTEGRKNSNYEYNKNLSGGMYAIHRCSNRKVLCDFNATQFEVQR